MEMPFMGTISYDDYDYGTKYIFYLIINEL